ncbi:transcriptional regulator with XRE-family HTH domain [Allostreptomyces psammosilenae]|uniref:Transcriptional regulator with XRE-family HTH domain n=2 Tax=Allostreptomyces psammosilenae TaxID=1892865 RepID=A0A853A5A4_9ACTN|nr:transcriptional regulator with XRE-family HTH domain [Allostreptomyces psammosilenae]
MSQSKISRIETGRILPSIIDVQQILNGLGVDQDTCDQLLNLTRVANTEYQDIRASVRRGLHHKQRELAALEANSRRMRHFLPTLVTGLLQLPQYMQAAMNTPIEPASGDASRAIALKLERQSVLHDKSKKFDFLLTESAIRWQLCEPSVMALQIDHLASISKMPTVRLGVIPLSTRLPEGAYHTFVTYDQSLVTIELFTGQLVLRDPKDVEHYHALFDFFATKAAFDEDARTLLRGWADDLR